VSRLPEWAERVVAGRVTGAVRAAILGMGESARETLGRIATSPAYRDPTGEGRRPGPAEAVDLLARMPYDDATAEQLVKSLLAFPMDAEAPRIVSVLRDFGVRAVPHLAAGLDAAELPMAAEWMCVLLADAGSAGGKGPRDESVLPALLAALRRHPGEAATALGRLGDPHAILPLRAVLAEGRVGADPSGIADLDLAMVGDAIERLGGELTVAERRKCTDADRRGKRVVGRSVTRLADERRKTEEALRSIADPPPNEPCPCGSGRKFKKCHEGDETFRRILEETVGEPADDEA